MRDLMRSWYEKRTADLFRANHVLLQSEFGRPPVALRANFLPTYTYASHESPRQAIPCEPSTRVDMVTRGPRYDWLND